MSFFFVFFSPQTFAEKNALCPDCLSQMFTLLDLAPVCFRSTCLHCLNFNAGEAGERVRE